MQNSIVSVPDRDLFIYSTMYNMDVVHGINYMGDLLSKYNFTNYKFTKYL